METLRPLLVCTFECEISSRLPQTARRIKYHHCVSKYLYITNNNYEKKNKKLAQLNYSVKLSASLILRRLFQND